MSSRKTERLLNLVIALLSTRRYLTVEQVHRLVPGYAESDGEAFRRMFERDKEELRELGIPLETGSDSVWEDEVGYRIPRGRYALPEISLQPDEAAALGLAARLWRSPELSAAVSGALLKLRAAGIDTDSPLPAGLEPRVDATEPAFGPLWQAVRDGCAVEFRYRAPGAPATVRHLEPWGVVSWRGRWYVAGHDRDRDATRVFRLSRVDGQVQVVGAPGSVQPPEGVDLVAVVAASDEDRPTHTARLRVRAGAAYELRRAAAAVEPAEVEGWDVLSVGYSDPERLADRVVGYGADAVVLEPAAAREAVVRRLRALVEAGR